VQFLGACTKKEPYILVTELMSGGSLADAFKRPQVFPMRRAVEIALDAARGLAYLHNRCARRARCAGRAVCAGLAVAAPWCALCLCALPGWRLVVCGCGEADLHAYLPGPQDWCGLQLAKLPWAQSPLSRHC
jgi:hypothetical protein